jgi:Flp pilus assembly protein TadG
VRAHREERGAAAVEFALVMPLLLIVLFGIVDYGLFFSNSLAARQGVREAARQAVVVSAPAGACASLTGYMTQLACTTKDEVGALSGTTYVKVFYDTWSRGGRLTVCAMVHTDGLIGLVPFPNHGYVQVRTDMAIEKADVVPVGDATYADSPPHDTTWDWCSGAGGGS